MGTTRRLLSFLAPYRGRLLGAIACMALFAASSGQFMRAILDSWPAAATD